MKRNLVSLLLVVIFALILIACGTTTSTVRAQEVVKAPSVTFNEKTKTLYFADNYKSQFSPLDVSKIKFYFDIVDSGLDPTGEVVRGNVYLAIFHRASQVWNERRYVVFSKLTEHEAVIIYWQEKKPVLTFRAIEKGKYIYSAHDGSIWKLIVSDDGKIVLQKNDWESDLIKVGDFTIPSSDQK